MPLENRQRLFGFVARILQQLEAHMEIRLRHDGRYDVRCELDHDLVGRETGHRTQQLAHLCRLFLGVWLAEGKQVTEDSE